MPYLTRVTAAHNVDFRDELRLRSRAPDCIAKEGTRTAKQVYDKVFAGNAAEDYQRFFVPAIGAPVAQDLMGVAKLQPGERVLDVACGTGVVARLAAERVDSAGLVAGLDVNPEMLAVARSRSVRLQHGE